MTGWSIRKRVTLCAFALLLAVPCRGEQTSNPQEQTKLEEVRKMVKNIHWLSHSSFRIEAGGKVIYIDPWQLGDGPKADLILITHDHGDHCSPEDVEKIRKEGTATVTVASAAEKLPDPITVVKPGDELTVQGVAIQAVAAYNVNKFRSPGVLFHPKEASNVGFVITVEGQRIYHAGDTDVIPEMASIKTDIALLPVSGKYVMTAEEAVEAVASIKPKIAIPMHVGRGIGAREDAERFKEKASVPVEVLPIESQ